MTIPFILAQVFCAIFRYSRLILAKKIAIVTNETVAPLYLNQLTDLFKKNNIQYFTYHLTRWRTIQKSRLTQPNL